MSGRWLTRIAAALLFVSLAWSTLPRLIAIVTNARTLLPLSYEARRERQMGPWYASIEKLRRELPKNEQVALIAPPRDLDAAVFANYYLYPIRTRIYAGRNAYRNAAPDPTRPRILVAVNASHAERTNYEILRDRDLRAGHRVVTMPQLSEPATTFILPIAASLDGPAPDTFLIEAVITNTSAQKSFLQATFMPRLVVRRFTLDAGATVSYYDLVYQLFGVPGIGWMDIQSTAPVRAAFYFVNRGRGDATLLPISMVSALKGRIPPGPLYRDNKLFVFNPYWMPTVATIAGETFPMMPGQLISQPIQSVPVVSGDVYAFVTTRELNGRTDFLWPK
jgi:hypothetical protein